ncbi:Pre-mRNA-splicing factor cwf25 OS=Schizosaccharomyces pombe (strain 972 / ATCC 24843) GN=cwf25 PE=1 SV=1 [Rhizoctonia solani AG-1 IB]|uniref:Pre-mRNA-splicing factor cwf25 n=1 Tax=Thanatephorus cucumeris (strain AG1-IB / isolate 7/3/14) TaxID=1108050 RepID=A0A0B7FH91_THACB|nr:Pre-mRNA-splicing factor cwf25 OS=Schizosaccharomyces pombe (strain 972 / ATCC 24843) GN=cwf25 PE=1 SV=1 [Rhizoctonia solani AG-1 IB]
MGGGDLNMKKSWHPLLMKNQERVWLEEKKALEEKKKLDQLRKELEEERQLQELQRLQEAQTGKKKVEKLEWMYATPATGGGPSANELEEYLLGKKRVDQMLKGDESAKVGASHKNFIAVQNANNVRDTAAKIREDPMFAIKQQEQAEYAALMSNPLRLRAMKERAGIVDEKDKAKDKEERKRLKKEKKRERRHRDERSSSPRGRDSRRHHEHDRDRHEHRHSHRRDDRSRSLDRSPRRSSRHDASPRRPRYDSPPRYHRSDDTPPRNSHRSRSRSPARPPRQSSGNHGDERPSGSRSYSRSRSPPRYRDRSPRPPPRNRSPPRRRSPPPHRRAGSPPRGPPQLSAADRAARLAAMTSDADSMQAERDVRLTEIKKLEEAEAAAEEAARAKASKEGGKGSFMRDQEKALYGGAGIDLAERLRRGRKDLVRERD